MTGYQYKAHSSEKYMVSQKGYTIVRDHTHAKKQNKQTKKNTNPTSFMAQVDNASKSLPINLVKLESPS